MNLTLIALLLATRLIVVVIAITDLHTDPVEDPDIVRFHQLATKQGTPYRDYQVEYAPIELLGIRVIAGGDLAATGTRVVLVVFAADLITWAGLLRGWGRRAGAVYLLLGAPLLPFIYLRLDLVAVALALWAVVLAREGRQRGGGFALATATLLKLWPFFLVPGLLLLGRRRATAWVIAAALCGVAAWGALTTPDAPIQVATFRGAGGWSVESTIGTVVWMVTGEPVTLEAGSPRVGHVPGWARFVLAIALGIAVGIVWMRSRRSDLDPFGIPTLGILGALLALSPLFSLQYASWLLPWGAVAEGQREGGRSAVLVGVISASTGILFLMYAVDLSFATWPILLLRAGSVTALWLLAIRTVDGSSASAGPDRVG